MSKIEFLDTLIEISDPQIEIPVSCLRYIDILRALREELSDIVFLPDTTEKPECYEIVFLLGGVSQKYRVEEAAKNFHEGRIERIIATGGKGFFSTDRKETEATRMRRQLLDSGVPEANIIIEDKSRNTFENIQNSIAKLRADYIDLSSIDKAILTSDFHLRRAVGMLVQQLDGAKVYGIGAKDGKTDFDHWFTNPYGRDLIKKEALLLLWYVKHYKVPDFNINNPKTLARLKH